MLSNDKNVESIAQLVEVLKRYVGLQGEYLKLDAIEKLVQLATALTVTVVVTILTVAVLLFLSFAAIYWMEPWAGLTNSCLIVATFYAFLLALVYINRKAWIERPLVHLLSHTLLK